MVTSGQYQRAKHGRLPDWFLEQPRLIRGDVVYLDAFWRLHTTRQVSHGGIGPIPWHLAFDYGERVLRFSWPTSEVFASVVLALDSLYREHLLKEDEKKQKATEKQVKRETNAVKGAKSLFERRRR